MRKEENSSKEEIKTEEEEEEDVKSHKFSKEGMTKILNNSGFLPINGKMDPKTEGLIEDVWKIAQGER